MSPMRAKLVVNRIAFFSTRGACCEKRTLRLPADLPIHPGLPIS